MIFCCLVWPSSFQLENDCISAKDCTMRVNVLYEFWNQSAKSYWWLCHHSWYAVVFKHSIILSEKRPLHFWRVPGLCVPISPVRGELASIWSSSDTMQEHSICKGASQLSVPGVWTPPRDLQAGICCHLSTCHLWLHSRQLPPFPSYQQWISVLKANRAALDKPIKPLF